MARYTCLSMLAFAGHSFVLESVSDPWGEDDPLVEQCLRGEFDENTSLSYWLFLASRAKPDALFVDVGAYGGIYSLLLAQANPFCKVLALEAASVTYGRLVRNVILNGAETVVCAAHFAASDSAGIVEFSHRYGIYSMCPGDSTLTNSEVDHVESVFTLALDNIQDIEKDLPGALGSRSLGIKSFSEVAAIKIDVEGAELKVLQGAQSILMRQRPVVLCEVLTEDALAAVEHYVGQFDYLVARVPSERNALLIPKSEEHSLKQEFEVWSATKAGLLTMKAQRKWLHLVG